MPGRGGPKRMDKPSYSALRNRAYRERLQARKEAAANQGDPLLLQRIWPLVIQAGTECEECSTVDSLNDTITLGTTTT